MRQVTLCFLVKRGEICLAMKKRGFGAGKWNGVGGKVEYGESIKEAVIREAKEEIGVQIHPTALQKVGDIKFYFNENPEWNQQMNIFFVKDWSGEPVESEEMLPQWHSHSALPFENMWVDDEYWLPLVINGKKIQGEFYFKGDGESIDKFNLKEI
ncbi:8-oxo-dGTP diphosphatase [Patescibacteria group bacterium]